MQKLYCLWFALVFSFTTNIALCQINTGTIAGIITDSSGGVIPNAQIQATNELTGQTRIIVSNDAGYYTFALLPIGRYKVAATASGFDEMVKKGFPLSAGQVISLDFQLQLGTVAQTITVSSSGATLNTTGVEQNETLGATSVHELPLPKGDWTGLLALGNGVATGGNEGVSLNGLPTAAMSLTVDGTNSTPNPEIPTLAFDKGFNTINIINTDAIAEVSITKGIAPASSGASMSGNINIISKSGTNEFHGTLYESNDNSGFDARNQFLTGPKPHSVFNEFGGSLGGPILKNRLFFFGDYEGLQRRSYTVLNDVVPTPEFIQKTVATAPEYAPTLKAYPAPNQPYNPTTAITAGYIAPSSLVQNDGNGVARLDYYLNPNDQLTLRVTRSRPYELLPRVIATNAREFAGHDEVYNSQFTHSASNWTAATRFGFNRLLEVRIDKGYASNLNRIKFSGMDSLGAEAYTVMGNTLTLQEDGAISRRKHTLEAGVVFQRKTDGRIDDTTTTFQYSSQSTFFANQPSSLQISFPLTPFQLQTLQIGGYIQDTYRIDPRFTVNAGIRYDYFTVPTERDNRLFTRNAGPQGPGTGSLKPPSQIYQSYWPNFSPRVGFAWTADKNGHTVVRGGFGIFFNPHTVYGGPIDDVLDGPYVPFQLKLNSSQVATMGLSYPVDKAALQQQLISSQAPVATTAINSHFPNPYSLQWMLDVQQDLGHGFIFDTGYIGTRGVHLNLNEMANLPDRLTAISPAANLGEFRYYQAGDRSSYHAWQNSLERKFRNGLVATVNYTWSRSFAFGDGDIGLEAQPQDNNNIRAEYGPSPMDVPSNFNTHVVYMIPFKRWMGTGYKAKLLAGGWQVGSIITATSGSPANVTNANSSYPADRPDRVNGTNLYLSNYQGTRLYLNKAAFLNISNAPAPNPTTPASGAQLRPGDLGHNAIRTPGKWDVDMSLSKSFALPWESSNFQLRVDLFNAFNHTNLGGLVTGIAQSNFGSLTSATARTIQIWGKLNF